MDWSSALENQLNKQFLSGEISDDQRSLKGKLDGQDNSYGKLGNFAKLIDQSAQRNYVEEGYLKNSLNNFSSKMWEISMQEPNATVLVKKKMYSTLARNFIPEYMTSEDRITFLAMDRLFANKCKQISAYEKLCKIEKAAQKTGEIDNQILPFIIGLSDIISNAGVQGSFFDIISKIKSVYNYSVSSFYTQWIEDVVTPYSLRYGIGTGVIELTNFTSITTNCGTSQGTFTLNIDDPYNLMTVTPLDIENAISDTVSGGANFISLGKETQQEIINKKIGELNNLRASRGASNISFKINQNTVYGKKVIAIVDRTAQEIFFDAKTPGFAGNISDIGSITGLYKKNNVSVAEPYLLNGEVLGKEGLSKSVIELKIVGLNNTNSELSLFQDIINAIFNQINIDNLSIRDYDFLNGKNSETINYIRRKLTFYFAGKNIVQPMDTVSIYMSSRAKYDTKVMSGIQNAFTGFGLLTDYSNTKYNIDTWGAISGNAGFQIEKSAFLNNVNIPNYLWDMMRGWFTSEKEGVHVFAGIVDSSSSSYSDGAYTVSIGGKDNTHYLEQGAVNFNPGADSTFTGLVYDPLTPYETSFDQVYSLNQDRPLLKENQERADKGLLKYSAGVNAGNNANNNLNSEIQYSKVDFLKNGKKVSYNPNGLVYKWKEGIGMLNLAGASNDIFTPTYFGQQSATKDVFAGQDVMNKISLLVTGVPYNYANYYKSGIETGNLTVNQNKDNSTSLSSQANETVSRLSQLTAAIQENNVLWGNFVPFKNLSLDDKSYQNLISSKMQSFFKVQASLQEDYKKLQQLQSSTLIASLYNNATDEVSSVASSDAILKSSEYGKVIDKINEKENSYIKYTTEKGMTIIGNDVSTDYSYLSDNGIDYSDPKNRRELRKKINFLTRRLSWAVRSNQDVNYFIVDDAYDKIYDLIALEVDISNQQINLYSNELTNVLQQAKQSADLLNLEFFADTQGHIRVRPQQYNRMPSSVFYRMLQNKNGKNNFQIYPQFLNDLYFNQIQTLYNQLTVTEDYLRFFAAIAGIANNEGEDSKIVSYIKNSTTEKLKSPVPFSFLSSSNGEVGDFKKIYGFPNENEQVDPDQNKKNNDFQTAKQLADAIQSQLNIKNVFDISGRLSKFIKDFTPRQQLASDLQALPQENSAWINKLIDRIFRKTGVKVRSQDYVYSNFYGANASSIDALNGEVIFPKVYQVDFFKIDDEIAKKISERQKIIKSLSAIAKNAYEINTLNNNEITTQLLFPSLKSKGSNEIPEVFESLIEDESYDDYGPGSGSRYIIKNSQIKSYQISENPPEWTVVNVVGRLDRVLPKEAANGPGFAQLPGGGNSLISSTAIDYDLWKMYGLKSTIPSLDKPFLTNPQTQTAPFAASVLAEQRKKIIKGSVTIFGNEYAQPGEVIYLEQRGMLFYVESVQHSMTMGSDFYTTLTLSYGHYPGEYIPTTLDLAGKMIYNNKDNMTIQNIRNIDVVNGRAVGCFIVKSGVETSDLFSLNPNKDALRHVAEEFIREINSNSDPNINIVLRVVYYSDSSSGKNNNNQNVINVCNDIKKIFNGEKTIASIDISGLGRDKINSDIKIIDVDLNPAAKNVRHSASKYALSQVEKLLKSDFSDTRSSIEDINKPATNVPDLSNPDIKKINQKFYLINNIIDCFIKKVPK